MKNKIVKVLWTIGMPIIIVCSVLFVLWLYIVWYPTVLLDFFGQTAGMIIWGLTPITLILLEVFHLQTHSVCYNCAYATSRNPMYNSITCRYTTYHINNGDECCPRFVNRFKVLRDEEEQHKFEEQQKLNSEQQQSRYWIS